VSLVSTHGPAYFPLSLSTRLEIKVPGIFISAYKSILMPDPNSFLSPANQQQAKRRFW